MSIGELLKNAYVSQLGTGENPTTASYTKATKPEIFFDETKTIKKAKITKWPHPFENYAHISFIETWILLIQNCISKMLNLQLKITIKIVKLFERV